MTLTVSTECVQNDKVGSKWTYRYLMNGTPVHAVQNMMVEAGKTIRLESEIIEHDEQPDLGSAENNYYVEKSALEDGFEIRQEVYVQENRPKLAGNTASFVVTYRFSDAVE
jgi:predicted amino acid racemase